MRKAGPSFVTFLDGGDCAEEGSLNAKREGGFFGPSCALLVYGRRGESEGGRITARRGRVCRWRGKRRALHAPRSGAAVGLVWGGSLQWGWGAGFYSGGVGQEKRGNG